MGCGNSVFDEYMARPDMQDCMRQFKAMQFSKGEIRKLFDIFRAVDADASGSIALSELLAHINLDRTPFTQKIFSIFDDDRSGEIDFKEFVMSLWNYCTLTKNTLGECPPAHRHHISPKSLYVIFISTDMFAFDLYDRDGSGELNPSEVTRMVQDIYGKAEAKSNFHAKGYE
jgi:serine/threonine-protein phosphatase 2B regulatory subunit